MKPKSFAGMNMASNIKVGRIAIITLIRTFVDLFDLSAETNMWYPLGNILKNRFLL